MQEGRNKGGGGTGGSLLSAAALMICMLAGREDKCAGYFILHLRRSISSSAGGGDRSLLSERVYCYARQRVGRVRARDIFSFGLPQFNLRGLFRGGGGKGYWWLSTINDCALGMHTSGSA